MPSDLSAANPLRGMVGMGAGDAGCSHVLQTSDMMGNVCVNGGADVTVSCEHASVESTVSDLQDGTCVPFTGSPNLLGHLPTHPWPSTGLPLTVH